MVFNQEKSHFMCIAQKTDDAEILDFNDLAIKNSNQIEILGVVYYGAT